MRLNAPNVGRFGIPAGDLEQKYQEPYTISGRKPLVSKVGILAIIPPDTVICIAFLMNLSNVKIPLLHSFAC